MQAFVPFVYCSMASTIIQLYLKQVLESFFHSQSQVRMCALSVIVLILGQGLVHPVQVRIYLSFSLALVLLAFCGFRACEFGKPLTCELFFHGPANQGKEHKSLSC